MSRGDKEIKLEDVTVSAAPVNDLAVSKRLLDTSHLQLVNLYHSPTFF